MLRIRASRVPIRHSSPRALTHACSGRTPRRIREDACLKARPVRGPGLVRLRVRWNSRVKVPDLPDTVGAATESNCIGAITPGGEQLEVNHQSVTVSVQRGGQSELDSVGGFGEPARQWRSSSRIEWPALREGNASGRETQMVGDRMVGSSGDVNQGTTAGDDQRACRGQSVRSSEEASNDRGAKGRRKAVLGAEQRPSREDRRSAARLSASVRRKTAWLRFVCRQWAARNWVSGSARTARLACSLRTSRNTSLSQPIEDCRPESCMREIRPYSLGGRGERIALLRSSCGERAEVQVTRLHQGNSRPPQRSEMRPAQLFLGELSCGLTSVDVPLRSP